MELTFSRRLENQTFLGYECRTSERHYFFGSAHLTEVDLARHFPDYKFSFLRQVHGNTLVQSTAESPAEADAHWTILPGHALVIQTADCLPILIGTDDQLVCAIHAGWRGVANGLVEHCARWLKSRGAKQLSVAIGPHIQFEDFEVGHEVVDQLRIYAQATDIRPHSDPKKKYVNLLEIVKRQLDQHFPRACRVYCLPDSTLTSTEFHSYRRGKSGADRNLSFLALT